MHISKAFIMSVTHRALFLEMRAVQLQGGVGEGESLLLLCKLPTNRRRPALEAVQIPGLENWPGLVEDSNLAITQDTLSTGA